jgi:hypothetical protein
MPAPALIESFCERCGTRYTFEPPRQRGRLLMNVGKTLGLLEDDGQDETTSALSGEPFPGTFHFCLECRQYTCGNCWNTDAGFCQGCVPMEGVHDDLHAAESAADLEASTHVLDELHELTWLKEAESWPSADLSREEAEAALIGFAEAPADGPLEPQQVDDPHVPGTEYQLESDITPTAEQPAIDDDWARPFRQVDEMAIPAEPQLADAPFAPAPLADDFTWIEPEAAADGDDLEAAAEPVAIDSAEVVEDMESDGADALQAHAARSPVDLPSSPGPVPSGPLPWIRAGQAVAGQAVAGQAVAGQAVAGQAVAGQAVEPESPPESPPELEPGGLPESLAEAEPVTGPALVAPEPIADSITELDAEPVAQTELSVQAGAGAKPVAELAAELVAPEPIADSITELDAEPVAQTELSVQAGAGAKPVAEFAAEPVAEFAAEPVAEFAAEPVADEVIEPEPATVALDDAAARPTPVALDDAAAPPTPAVTPVSEEDLAWDALLQSAPHDEPGFVDPTPSEWAALTPHLGPDVIRTVAPAPRPAVPPEAPSAPRPAAPPPVTPLRDVPPAARPESQLLAPPPVAQPKGFRGRLNLGRGKAPSGAGAVPPGAWTLTAPEMPHQGHQAALHAAPPLMVEQPKAAAQMPSGVKACHNCALPLSARARFCRRCGQQQG